jgi:hypothetical protein
MKPFTIPRQRILICISAAALTAAVIVPVSSSR